MNSDEVANLEEIGIPILPGKCRPNRAARKKLLEALEAEREVTFTQTSSGLKLERPTKHSSTTRTNDPYGQRRSEVAEMKWSEVDFKRAIWTIPAARSKNSEWRSICRPSPSHSSA